MSALSNLRRIVATLEEHLSEAEKDENVDLAYTCRTILASINSELAFATPDGKFVLMLDLADEETK